MRSYCKNASNDKKSHDFGSIQRVCKRILHGTYRWRNPWFFSTIISHDSPVRTQETPLFQRKKKKRSLVNWVISTLRVIIFTELDFTECLSTVLSYRENIEEKKFDPAQKNWQKRVFFEEINFREQPISEYFARIHFRKLNVSETFTILAKKLRNRESFFRASFLL